jgi:hypothetical protein
MEEALELLALIYGASGIVRIHEIDGASAGSLF